MTMTLFDSYERPSPLRHLLQKLCMLISYSKERFALYAVLSAFLHITLLGSLFVYRSIHEEPANNALYADDFEAFHKALEGLSPLPDDPEMFANMLATLTDEDIKEGFLRAPKLDERLTPKERVAILRSFLSKSVPRVGNESSSAPEDNFSIENIFNKIRGRSDFRAADGSKFIKYGAAAGPLAKYYRLAQESEQRLQYFKNLEQKDRPIAESRTVSVYSESGINWVPSEYFYRQVPYEQILAIGARLYYFVEGFPVLDPPKNKAAETQTSGPAAGDFLLDLNIAKQGLTLVFVTGSKAEAGAHELTSPAPTVLTSDTATQILDNLNEYPDEMQFEKFRSEYLQKYDADNPLLARLTRDFIYQNLGTVFILIDPLSAGFDLLEGVYYRKLTMDGFVSYYLNNQNTKTAAEVLFCLAAYYNFERRSLRRLSEAIEVAEKVLADPDYQLDVFELRAKAFVLQQIYYDVISEIQARGYSSLEAVLQHYRDQQASVYNLLMTAGGGIRDRALFSLGTLYWDETRMDMAIKTWKEISPAFSENSFRKIRGFITRDESGVLEENITRVLDDETIANRQEMLERLEKFHKWGKGRQ